MMTRQKSHDRVAPVLAVLFAGAFVMGSAEMLVVGMIDLIAADLTVSVSTAGALVTANALGLAVGGPALTFLTTRLDRRAVLLGTIVVFVLLNLLPALAADYPLFLLARVVIGAAQGLFIAAAITTAVSITPPERAGRAMAIVISGFATSSALGLPLGTLLGQALGWRASFLAVVIVAALVLVAAVVVLPSVPSAARRPTESGAAGRSSAADPGSALGQVRHAFAPRVLAVLAVAFLMFAGIQSALTYLVPYLDEVTGVSGSWVSVFLLAYGVATAFGSFAGGRFADANAARSMVVGTLGVTVSLLAMLFFGHSPVLVIAAILGTGLFGMGIAPSLQHRVVSLAGAGAPLASSLPASAVNAGIAVGSFAGGVAIDLGEVPDAVLTGAAIAAVAVAAAWATRILKPAAAAAPTLTSATDQLRNH
jgi:DHA1 family inner membrane transport protein